MEHFNVENVEKCWDLFRLGFDQYSSRRVRDKKTRPPRSCIEKGAIWNISCSMYNTMHSVRTFIESALISTRRNQSNKKHRAPLGAILKSRISEHFVINIEHIEQCWELYRVILRFIWPRLHLMRRTHLHCGQAQPNAPANARVGHHAVHTCSAGWPTSTRLPMRG